MELLIEKVKKWSKDRNLHVSDSNKQFLKIVEELGEVSGAYARGNIEEMKKELGDVLVTLIIFAQQNQLDLKECLELAYNKILYRKGKMINGVFIKEEDLI